LPAVPDGNNAQFGQHGTCLLSESRNCEVRTLVDSTLSSWLLTPVSKGSTVSFRGVLDLRMEYPFNSLALGRMITSFLDCFCRIPWVRVSRSPPPFLFKSDPEIAC
jgi:hypothetical protein